MLDSFTTFGSSLLGPVWPVAWAVIKIVALIIPLMLSVAYLTLWERKAIGWSQIRPGQIGRASCRERVCYAV